jgi:uncharacterized membrane protein
MTTSRARAIVYTVAAIIPLAGLTDAAYLTVQYLTGETAVCGGSPDCFKVLGSAYSHFRGIPVAGVGALAYYSAFTFAIFAAFGYGRARKFFSWLIWGMFLVTLWFLFVQAFVLHAFCRYCLFSAAIVFLLTGLVVATPTADYSDQ